MDSPTEVLVLYTDGVSTFLVHSIALNGSHTSGASSCRRRGRVSRRRGGVSRRSAIAWESCSQSSRSEQGKDGVLEEHFEDDLVLGLQMSK